LVRISVAPIEFAAGWDKLGKTPRRGTQSYP
jgi:hypothetical protein